MRQQDIPLLFEIDRNTWSPLNSPGHPPVNADSLRKLKRTHVIVACINDTPVGYVHLMETVRPPTSRHVVTISIAVALEFQGKGIGTRLLQQAEVWAREHEKRKLILRVLTTNPRAIALYSRCGFIEEGRLRNQFFIEDTYVDDVLMYKMI